MEEALHSLALSWHVACGMGGSEERSPEGRARREGPGRRDMLGEVSEYQIHFRWQAYFSENLITLFVVIDLNT